MARGFRGGGVFEAQLPVNFNSVLIRAGRPALDILDSHTSTSCIVSEMKVLPFILLLIIIMDFLEISRADDELDLVAMKRPFCNAFTGCGKKRNQNGGGGIQLPIPFYKALLQLATMKNGSRDTRMRQMLLQQESQQQQQQHPQLPLPPRTPLI